MTKLLTVQVQEQYTASLQDMSVPDLVQETLDVLHRAGPYFGSNDQKASLCLHEFQRRGIPEVYDKTHKLFYAEAKQAVAVGRASNALLDALVESFA